MSPVVKIILIITGIAIVAGICYLVYRFLTPDYLEDFDDDLDDFDELEEPDDEEEVVIHVDDEETEAEAE